MMHARSSARASCYRTLNVSAGNLRAAVAPYYDRQIEEVRIGQIREARAVLTQTEAQVTGANEAWYYGHGKFATRVGEGQTERD